MYIQLAVAGFALLIGAIIAGILKTSFQLRAIRRSYSVDAVARARPQHGRDRPPLPAGPASLIWPRWYWWYATPFVIVFVVRVVFHG
jgi:hypothetical protein